MSQSSNNFRSLFSLHIPSVAAGFLSALSAMKLYSLYKQYSSSNTRNHTDQAAYPPLLTIPGRCNSSLPQLLSDLSLFSQSLEPHNSLLQYYYILGRLKHERRQGWLLRGVNDSSVESVADHQYRMAMMALSLPGIDNIRCCKLALIHDVAESLVSDIVPQEDSNITKGDKHDLELRAINIIVDLLKGDYPALATEIKEFYEEYAEQRSPSALIVKQLDKLDMIIQAFEYEIRWKSLSAEQQKSRPVQQSCLEEFFSCTAEIEKNFPNQHIAAVVRQLMQQRAQLI
jgi:putative hydrolase of HD superfamily